MENRPAFSIVMPVYNTEDRHLRACLDSIRSQIYPLWELCIANDASTAPNVATTLDEYARLDSRIKVVHRPENGHISAASNSALKLATGDYLALVDHDDLIPPHALFCFAQEIQFHPDAKVLYSDEDHIDDAGVRHVPYFKPHFNEELLCGQNYISHFGVYEAALVRAVGGFRVGMEGSQDWDLALRCIACIRPDQVRHLPYVLYHWRAYVGATTFSMTVPSKAADSAVRAVGDFIAAKGGGKAIPHPLIPGCVQVVRGLNPTTTDVEEVMINLNQVSLDRKNVHLAHELNEQVRRTASRFVLLVDSQCTPMNEHSGKAELFGIATMIGVGCVAGKVYYADKSIRHAGLVTGLLGEPVGRPSEHTPGHHHGAGGRVSLTQELSAVSLECMMLSREAFEQVGGFDPETGPYCGVDFCLRLRAAGFKVMYTPFAEFVLSEQPKQTAKIDNIARSVMKMRWGHLLANDPFYNTNLSLDTLYSDLTGAPRHPPAWSRRGPLDISVQPSELPFWWSDATSRSTFGSPKPYQTAMSYPRDEFHYELGEIPPAGQDY